MTDNIFERIKNEANIVEVISKRVNLKKKGRAWVGLCPFHNDHNPSMFVSSQKQLYKCFSCNAGGDVIKFVMEYDKLTLKDAMKLIAGLYHIQLPKTFNFRHAEKIDRFLNMKILNAWAMNVYHLYLFTAKGGLPGRRYLKTRKLSKTVMKVFKIGYAPDNDSGEGFLTRMILKDSQVKNFSWQKSSLFSNSYGKRKDFFRNRILFPIYSEKGEVLGFGGRTLGQEEPKYLNVRESPWFRKREVLYGLKESYNRILQDKQVYVVEGYLDVIACYEIGIPAVAPLGTALTREQLLKLKRYADKVHLLFDGDDSGKNAAWRAALDMVSLSMDGKVIILSAGVDPFDLIKKNPLEKVKKILEGEGVNIYRYLVEEITQNRNHWSPVEKKQALDTLLPIHHSIIDPTVRQNFSDMIGEYLVMDWEKYLRENSSRSSSSSPKKITLAKKHLGSSKNLLGKERSFVLFLCNNPRFFASALPVINIDNFEDGFARYVYHKLFSLKDKIGELSFQDLLQSFRDDGQDKVADYISNSSLRKDYFTAQLEEEDQGGKGEKTEPERLQEMENDFNTRMVILKQEHLKKKKDILHEKITLAQQEYREENERELYEEYTALKVEEDNLKNYLEKI